MDVVAEDLDHQVQHFLVLAEHDVRSGGIEREALLDDRSAEAADPVALFQDLDVLAEVSRQRDPGNAPAEDPDGALRHDLSRMAIECCARKPWPICVTTFVPSGSTV